MNIVQTYYNKNVAKYGLNFSGGYLSPEVYWLSMAYSCLLLRKYNTSNKIVLYANRSIIDILVGKFNLPYDEFVDLEDLGQLAEWFYCWPKLVTYSLQKSPFIHVDTDVFISAPLGKKFHNAELIAQHEEKDSVFYRVVYDNAIADKIILPAFLEECYEDRFIKSYNAGLFGGKDLDFIKEYINEILKFTHNNQCQLKNSQKKFLYNVLMEQWFFYALSRQKNKNVKTYYDSVITNFKMPGIPTPERIIYDSDMKYVHIMEYKDNIRCNKYIVYRMATEFPDYYKRITNACRNQMSLSNNNVYEDYSKGWLKERKKALLLSFANKRLEIRKKQFSQYKHFEEIRLDDNALWQYSIYKSPYTETIKISKHKCEQLLPNPYKSINDPYVIIAYNAIFDKVDEYVWGASRIELLNIFESGVTLGKIIQTFSLHEKCMIVNFVKQCLFDQILYLRR